MEQEGTFRGTGQRMSSGDDSRVAADRARATHISLPPAVLESLGWPAGVEMQLVFGNDRLELLPSIHELGRLYIEPTTRCNLSCRTCVRQEWDEPKGDMDMRLFDRLLGQLREFSVLRSVMFGGFGEPTTHNDILHMVGAVKSLGLRAELTTNGTLLDRAMLAGLLAARLDTLWVSFDGTGQACFDAIRDGADFNGVVQNLATLQALQERSGHKIELGIAFVAMRSNVGDLAHLPRLARAVGAKRVSVSNVLPYTWDMQAEMLCPGVLSNSGSGSGARDITVSLPFLDLNDDTKDPLFGLLRSGASLSVLSNNIGQLARQCRFIKDRCTFVRWDGAVSPCMGLLHSHVAYTKRTQAERRVKAYSLGDVVRDTLPDIWQSAEYRGFRERVNAFDFSPCSACGGCQYSETNEADCIGNTFPTCGGCLWARGVIQCP